jgi:nucleotide-binding universal stress UspA family protein
VAGVDPLERILCGVDASGAGLDAVRQALALSRPDSELVLVGVSESHLASQAGMLAPHAVETMEAELREALDAAREIAGRGETRFIRGRADEALLQIAAESRATLVAVGSHDRRRASGVLLGGVATRMLHDAPCSVLVARSRGEVEGFPSSIAAGVDGSAPSLAAAEVALELGKRVGTPVELVTAKGAGSAEDTDLHAIEGSGVAVAYSDAKPLDALLEAAQGVDLLVVASRGLRGLRALGSVSERIAHQAPCSVLVLRGAD